MIGYLVKLADLHQFAEVHSIPKGNRDSLLLVNINHWIRAQKAKPPIPILRFSKVDGQVTGLVLTRYLRNLPEKGGVQETEVDQVLKNRFAQTGDLEAQSSLWSFAVLPLT